MKMPEEILKSSRFFGAISEKSLSQLLSISKEKKLRGKDILFLEGDTGKAVYILLSGTVQLYKTSPEGKEIVVRLLKPGDVFAEVILFEKDQYPVSAVSLEKSSVLEISRTAFLDLLDENIFRNDFISMLLGKQRYLAERIAYVSAYDVEERLRLFLKDHFGEQDSIECSLSKKDIASSICTTPESLSRLLLKLKKRNLLRWEQQVINVSEEFWESE